MSRACHAVSHAASHARCHAVTTPVSHGPVTPVVTVPPTRPDPTHYLYLTLVFQGTLLVVTLKEWLTRNR